MAPDEASASAAGWPIPVVDTWWAQGIIVLVAFTVMLSLSGVIVRAVVGRPAFPSQTKERLDAGAVIGKCENILAFVFILGGQYDALGFVLAAKTIARLDAIKKEPSYYLGGTLVNIVWSVLVAVLTRLCIFGTFS